MSEPKPESIHIPTLYHPSGDFSTNAHVKTREAYLAKYQDSITDPEGFWSTEARSRIDWFTPFTQIRNTNFGSSNVRIRWFEDGQLNASYNCLDRHLSSRGDQTALIWEPDDPGDSPVTFPIVSFMRRYVS